MVFEEVENAGVVSLDQLNGGYISTIEQSHTADRFIAEFSWQRRNLNCNYLPRRSVGHR